MQRPERSMITLINAQQGFYTDRPLMGTHNNDLRSVMHLLKNEIEELNGHHDDYMTVEKYREQEVADIVWFCLGVLYQFGQFPTDGQLDDTVEEFGLTTTQVEWADAQAFSEEQETLYRGIKQEMLQEADAIADSQQRHVLLMQGEERERIVHGIQRILGLTWAMFALLRVNPHDAVIEKLARNHAKHQAKYYTDIHGDYHAARNEANAAWGSKANKEFYDEPSVSRSEREEQREIGLGYRLASQAIASLWGWQNR